MLFFSFLSHTLNGQYHCCCPCTYQTSPLCQTDCQLPGRARPSRLWPQGPRMQHLLSPPVCNDMSFHLVFEPQSQIPGPKCRISTSVSTGSWARVQNWYLRIHGFLGPSAELIPPNPRVECGNLLFWLGPCWALHCFAVLLCFKFVNHTFLLSLLFFSIRNIFYILILKEHLWGRENKEHSDPILEALVYW